jgi:hypothetical protein
MQPERSDWEVFYACPSLSAPAFFGAASRAAAEQLPGAGQGAADAYEALHELARVLQARPRLWLRGSRVHGFRAAFSPPTLSAPASCGAASRAAAEQLPGAGQGAADAYAALHERALVCLFHEPKLLRKAPVAETELLEAHATGLHCREACGWRCTCAGGWKGSK